MLKFFSKFIAIAVLLIAAPYATVWASNDDGDTEEEMTLQELLDSFKFGVDDYAYGTAPGYVGDEAVYADFYNTYSDAIQMASSTSATDEEKAAMCVKLKAAKEKVEAAINPVTDGTYYIITSYSVFADKDTMAWFAPYEGNYPGWKKKDNKILFMWNIKKLPSGNYSIQSAATGQYVFHNDVIDGQETNMYMTDTQQMEQVFENITPSGQFNIHCLGANWTYNIQHHNSGNATVGPIGNWVDKNISGEGSWRLEPVSAADLAAAEASKNFDLLDAKVNAFQASDYTLGTDPGQYSQAAYDALDVELQASKKILEDSVTTPTEEICKAQLEKFNAAKAALDASLVEVTDGYYSLSNTPYAKAVTSKTGTALTINGNSGWLYSFNWEMDNPAYIWKIKKLGEGRYSIQNYVTKEYVNSTDLVSAGASINLAKTQSTDQYITRVSGEQFNLSNRVIKASNMNYLYSTDLVWIGTGSGTATYLHKYTDAEVEEIANLYPQKLRTDTLKSLVVEANAYATADSVYTIDMTSPIVTDKSQLFITNQSTESSDLNNLIDNNFDSFCISAWNSSCVAGTSLDDYHAIRVDAGEGKKLPTHIGLHWRARGSSWKAMYRPVDVQFYVSDDAVNWEYIGERKNPEAGYPTAAEDPEFTSTNPITTSKPYRYLNMKVIKTNTMDLGLHSKPYFTFSEFNAYPMTGELNPELNDPEILQAVKDLRAAVAAAQPKVDAGNVTSQDIADFKAAYNNFLLVWKDTADLYNIYQKATELAPNIVPGDDMFCYPEDKVDDFETAFAEVDAARPFVDINQREVARLDTLLTRAYNALRNSMIGPDPNTWYFVSCADGVTNSNRGVPAKGLYTYMGGYTSVDGLGCSGLEDNYTDMRRVWKFEATGEPCVYNMICVGNGWPINRGPVRLEALGDGQFAIYTTADLNAAYGIHPNVGLPGVGWFTGQTTVKDGFGAWAMEEIPDEMTRKLNFISDKAYAMVNPFDTEALPTCETDGHDVQTYKICGYELADDGKTVTGINLTEFVPDDEIGGIPAGTPFIMIIDGGQPYDNSEKITINFNPLHGGNVSRTLASANGLYGTFSLISELPQGNIYFAKDSAYVVNGQHSVSPLGAYVNVNAINIDAEASVDYTVPVSGLVEIATGIHANIIKSNEIVSVYTTDGVLVKKNVKAAKATNGLAKGIYVIGKKKVLVK